MLVVVSLARFQHITIGVYNTSGNTRKLLGVARINCVKRLDLLTMKCGTRFTDVHLLHVWLL